MRNIHPCDATLAADCATAHRSTWSSVRVVSCRCRGMALAGYSFITIPEAQEIVLSHTQLLPAEEISLAQAYGRTLAAPVTAADNIPPFPASIKVHHLPTQPVTQQLT
jgi:hypothetical protein